MTELAPPTRHVGSHTLSTRGTSACGVVSRQVRDLPSVTQYMEAIAVSLLLKRPHLALSQLLRRLTTFDTKCGPARCSPRPL